MISAKEVLTMRLLHFATIIVVAALAAVLNAIIANAESSATIKVITHYDYPGLSLTEGRQISNVDTIVGFFTDSIDHHTKSFTRTFSGSFSAPIVDPNDNDGDTAALGINRSGKVVGSFEQTVSAVTTFHGFSLSKAVFTTFDVPGAFFTSTHAINDQGDFVGFTGRLGRVLINPAQCPLRFESD
jgi:hypothetical protein